MDADSKDPTTSQYSSDHDGKKPSSEEGTKQEKRTKQLSVGDRGESLGSIEYDGDEYDDYDDFDLTKLSGGGGGVGAKRDQKRKGKGSAGNIYSSKHTRMREARKGQSK